MAAGLVGYSKWNSGQAAPGQRDIVYGDGLEMGREINRETPPSGPADQFGVGPRDQRASRKLKPKDIMMPKGANTESHYWGLLRTLRIRSCG